MSIESELVEATGFEARKNYEDRQDYLAALARSVNDLDEEAYDTLSNEAVEWFNAACRALNNKKDIEDFEDAPVATGSEPVEEEAEPQAETEEEVKPKPKKVVAAKVAKPKAKVEEIDADQIELDEFGVAVGSKNSQAVEMLKKGCRMADISKEIGGTYYNLVQRLVKQGHTLEKAANGVLRLVHMDKARKKK